MKRDGLMWGLALGGGTLALMTLGREAEASRKPPGGGGEGQGGQGAAPLPTAVVAPTSSPRPRPGGAALPSWNRRADDGGPPLFVPDDVEALARVITSEVGGGPLAERLAIGWVARNRARKRAVNVARLVCQPCGKSSGNKRPFSTRQPATPGNRELAALILASPDSDDPTHGATSCFEPSLQDRLHAAGRKGHGLDARGVRHCWTKSMDYYGSVGRWDLFGLKGGPGARPVPPSWNLDGHSVCCSHDTRQACAGKLPGDRLEA